MKHENYFDHHANGRIYFISKGEDSWAVNDVTDMRNAPAKYNTANKLQKHYPGFWVAYAPTAEAAIEAANRDAWKN